MEPRTFCLKLGKYILDDRSQLLQNFVCLDLIFVGRKCGT